MEKNRAFTFIEIIIVLSISAIISSLTFVSYNYYTSKKQLQADVNKFISVLELAREKARGQDNSICKNSTDIVESYKVQINTLNEFILTANCKTSEGDNSISKEIKYYLEKNKFIDGTQGQYIEFEKNTGNNLNGNCQCFKLQSTINNFISDYVCIGKYGNIEIRKDTNC